MPERLACTTKLSAI